MDEKLVRTPVEQDIKSSSRDMRGSWPRALLSLFGSIVLVLAIRWAFFEPYVIPSGSMIPTLLVHDHILVNKLSYGVRFPFTSSWIFHFGSPRRGDVIVFRSVDDADVFLVKRLIGLPGDEIRVVGQGQLMINGQLVPRRQLSRAEAIQYLARWPVDARNEALEKNDIYEEDFDGHHHMTFRAHGDTNHEQGPYQVSADALFMMGDNRDNSSDSRVWGELPIDRVLGKASLIWLSCEDTLPDASQLCDPKTMRWPRLGKGIE